MSARAYLSLILAFIIYLSRFIMLVRIFLVILSVAALTRAAAVPGNGKSVEPACERYVSPMCTRDYNPVCGSDGTSYGNECMLCFENRFQQHKVYIVKKGEC